MNTTLLSAWNSFVGALCSLLKAMEHHPGLASWAQFLGAVGAIVAAIIISRSQLNVARLQEAQRRGTKARALGYLLAPSVAQIIVDRNHIRRTIDESEHGMALITPSTSTWDNAVNAMSFHVSPDKKLLRRIDALPNDAAVKIVQLFACVDHFNSFISSYLLETRSFDGEERGAFIADMDRKFGHIETLADDVKRALDAITGEL